MYRLAPSDAWLVEDTGGCARFIIADSDKVESAMKDYVKLFYPEGKVGISAAHALITIYVDGHERYYLRPISIVR